MKLQADFTNLQEKVEREKLAKSEEASKPRRSCLELTVLTYFKVLNASFRANYKMLKCLRPRRLPSILSSLRLSKPIVRRQRIT